MNWLVQGQALEFTRSFHFTNLLLKRLLAKIVSPVPDRLVTREFPLLFFTLPEHAQQFRRLLGMWGATNVPPRCRDCEAVFSSTFTSLLGLRIHNIQVQ